MPHNENSRVKIPALVHFTRLGYKYISLRKYEGVIDDDTNILVDVFCDAINRINATALKSSIAALKHIIFSVGKNKPHGSTVWSPWWRKGSP